MSIYVFYCLEPGDRQPEFELQDCHDDVEATAAAASLLKRRPEYTAVEIWRGPDAVGVARQPARHAPPPPREPQSRAQAT